MKKEDIEIFIDGIDNPTEPNQALIDAAERYKERSYSEEEVIQLVSDWNDYRMSEDTKSKVTFKKWFEQFKKK